MTPAELIAFATARHGPHWYGPLSKETDYSFSHLWRIANEDRKVGRKLEKAIKRLKPRSPANAAAGREKSQP